MAIEPTAFAIAGLGGNNAHGAGFLAAAQELQRQRDQARHDVDLRDPAPDGQVRRPGGRATNAAPGQAGDERARRGILRELECISCTSGAIASTAVYLQGDDVRADMERRIEAVEQVLRLLPRNAWTERWRAPFVALFTGIPHVFGPWVTAFGEHLRARLLGFYDPASPNFGAVPTTLEELLDLWYPARAFVPALPRRYFEDVSRIFNDAAHGVGVAFNSFDPKTGIEHLYLNQAGLDCVRRHHDKRAEYGKPHHRTVYEPVTPDAVRAALWLVFYGFPQGGLESDRLMDGAYARSTILDELTFAQRIYAVKPVSHRWIGRLPQNQLEIQDLQTELWWEGSYREQYRLIDTLNGLCAEGRLRDADQVRGDVDATAASGPSRRPAARAGGTHPDKVYHHVDLVEVEITTQRGFFDYFVESRQVFDEAYAQSLDVLLQQEEHRTGKDGESAVAERAQPR